MCGSASTTTTSSGVHHFATWPAYSPSRSAGSTSRPSFATTISSGRSSHFGWCAPTMAASATSGCDTAMFSSTMELIHSPPDFTMSLVRSVISMTPWGSMVATSPVANQPSASVASASAPR